MPAKLTGLEIAADEVIGSWPDVRAKNVFGHRGYVRAGKMFAFIADSGLSFRAESEVAAATLYEAGSAVPFVYNGSMEMRGWPVVPLGTDEDLAAALSAASEAYERAAAGPS